MRGWNLFRLSSALFDHQNVGISSLKNLSKKPYRTWSTVVKTFKKHESVPRRAQKKSKILLRRFLCGYT